MPTTTTTSQSQVLSIYDNEEDDDFIVPLTQTLSTSTTTTTTSSTRQPLKPLPTTNNNSSTDYNLSPKLPNLPFSGKENLGFEDPIEDNYGLDSIESSLDYEDNNNNNNNNNSNKRFRSSVDIDVGVGYLRNSVESRLLKGKISGFGYGEPVKENTEEEEEELDVLLRLCKEDDEEPDSDIDDRFLVECPLCGMDISDFSEEQRHVHTNECLDKGVVHDEQPRAAQPQKDEIEENDGLSPVVKWLRGLGLEKYEGVFVCEEVDWETLHWLTEEDLIGIGVSTLGPRKKLIHAINELRKERAQAVESTVHERVGGCEAQTSTKASAVRAETTSKVAANKLITDFFRGPVSDRKKVCSTSKPQPVLEKARPESGKKRNQVKSHARKGKAQDIPVWCQIPGTPFRVDAFKYLRGDCSHWFLTHFHLDHYQGLTKSFCRGKIYCSLITAKLVNMKIGIPWDKIEVLPLNQKINIAGTDVTCLDANHCPGSIIIIFEPPNSKVVLHTGDFRYNEDMTTVLQKHRINTLILDTTYCNPQYDFPRQEVVIEFVLDAIQAEAFNPKTLFLIGSYTIGKERLFLEVARVLRRKVYVAASKYHILKCLGISEEDMQWFTLNEQESHIHVVPMWMLASFKRLKHVANQYSRRFSLIVAFSPTGWTFGKGKQKSTGRRWQQGTLIRYEVPYSEHSSFTELKEFVKLTSPETIIPSVNNDGPDSANAMISLLTS